MSHLLVQLFHGVWMSCPIWNRQQFACSPKQWAMFVSGLLALCNRTFVGMRPNFEYDHLYKQNHWLQFFCSPIKHPKVSICQRRMVPLSQSIGQMEIYHLLCAKFPWSLTNAKTKGGEKKLHRQYGNYMTLCLLFTLQFFLLFCVLQNVQTIIDFVTSFFSLFCVLHIVITFIVNTGKYKSNYPI